MHLYGASIVGLFVCCDLANLSCRNELHEKKPHFAVVCVRYSRHREVRCFVFLGGSSESNYCHRIWNAFENNIGFTFAFLTSDRHDCASTNHHDRSVDRVEG